MLSLGNAFAEMVDKDMVVDVVRVRARTSRAAYAAVPKPGDSTKQVPEEPATELRATNLHANGEFGD